MQQMLIQYLLDPLCRRMEPVSGKVKNLLVLLGGSGILGVMFLRNAELLDLRYMVWYGLNLAFFALLLLGAMPEKLRPVKWNRPMLLFWMGAAVLRCVSGVTQNSNYMAEGLLLLAVWPVSFLILAGADHTRLIHLMLTLLRGSLLAFVALSFLLRPITPGEYTGLFENANASGHYLAAVSAALGLSILYDRGRKWIPDCVLLGLAWTMNLYTNSRTGLLAAVIPLTAASILLLTTRSRKRLLRLLGALGCTVVLMNVLSYGFQLRFYLNLPYFDPEDHVFYTATRNELWQEQGEQFVEYMEERIFFDASVFTDRAETRFDTEGKTLDRYSTGRLSLWMSCVEQLNLTGHPSTEDRFHTATRQKLFSTAHMVVLQFAFESGIPMGLCYLAMNLLSGFSALGYGWRKRETDWAALPLAMTLCFGVLSLLSSCTGSLNHLGTAMYYFTLFPLITRGEAKP